MYVYRPKRDVLDIGNHIKFVRVGINTCSNICGLFCKQFCYIKILT